MNNSYEAITNHSLKITVNTLFEFALRRHVIFIFIADDSAINLQPLDLQG